VSTDYYELLEVERDASTDEIKRAYRIAARRYHPDANPGDAEAEARFKEIANAYEVLSDDGRRAQYDRFGADGPQMGGDPFGGFAGGGLGDIFDAFFGGGGGAGPRPGRQSGPDLEVSVDIAFESAVFGAQEEVTVRTAVACETCEATGAAPGTHADTCAQCGGSGQVR
jgi:molecular chaperone DnaJ